MRPMKMHKMTLIVAILMTLAFALIIGCGSDSERQSDSKAELTTSQIKPRTVGKDVGSFVQRANLKEQDDSISCQECDLRLASLVEANLKKADLLRVDLGGADLSGADLSDADLGGASLWWAKLKGASLVGAKLIEIDLEEASLQGADLSGADLSGAKLYSAKLNGADLSGANLTGADFFGANLSGVVGADFSGALNLPVGTDKRDDVDLQFNMDSIDKNKKD